MSRLHFLRSLARSYVAYMKNFLWSMHVNSQGYSCFNALGFMNSRTSVVSKPASVTSTFTWLDYSAQDWRQMLDSISVFRDCTTLDDLGIGTSSQPERLESLPHNWNTSQHKSKSRPVKEKEGWQDGIIMTL